MEDFLSVQNVELSEVAELRWNGAYKLIPVDGPERATMNVTSQRLYYLNPREDIVKYLWMDIEDESLAAADQSMIQKSHRRCSSVKFPIDSGSDPPAVAP